MKLDNNLQTTYRYNTGLEAGTTAIGGGSAAQVGRSAFAGSVNGLFGATLGFGLGEGSLAGKLAFQASATTLSSIGDNFVAGRGLFSDVIVGVGPVNLTVNGNGVRYLPGKNIGNIVTMGAGLLNTGITRGLHELGLMEKGAIGRTKFHAGDLAFEHYGGIFSLTHSGGFTGAYAILGPNNSKKRGLLNHELVHIWQSRAFNNNFLPLWGLSGLYSVLNGFHFNDPIYNTTINYFEQQAEDF